VSRALAGPAPDPPRPPLRTRPRVGLRAATAAGAVAAACAAPAGAQAPAAPRDSSVARIEPVVVVGTRVPVVVGGAGAVSMRPDSLPLPTQPAPLLEQVLRQTPFVLVRQNARGEVELSVRGSDSRQAALLLDGLPLTLGWDHRADASLIPTTGVRRLTLVRGLGSLLSGPNALGGVIAVELNAAPTVDAAGRPAPDLAFGSGVDQYASRVATATAGAPLAVGRGVLTVRGGATYRRRDGFALSRGGGAGDGLTGGAADPGDARDAALRTNTDLRQADGFAAVRYDADGGAYVGLTATAYDARRGVAPELHVVSPRFWRYPESSRRLGVLSAGTGDRTTPLGRGRVDVSAGAYRGDVVIESFTSRAYTTVASRELGDERTASGRLTASHSLRATAAARGRHARRRALRRDARRPAAGGGRRALPPAAVEPRRGARVPAAGARAGERRRARDAAETPEAGGKRRSAGCRGGGGAWARPRRWPTRCGCTRRPAGARASRRCASCTRGRSICSTRTRRCAPSGCWASRPARR
jgi:hypothetical protein